MNPPVVGEPLSGPRPPRAGAARVGPGGALPSAAPARPAPEAPGGASDRRGPGPWAASGHRLGAAFHSWDCATTDGTGGRPSATGPEHCPATAAAADERGSGSLYAVGVLALVVAVVVVVVGVGQAFAARTRLQAAADLSALAGAEAAAVAAWEDVGDGPCSAAARVASANGASTEKCDLHGSDCRVELVRRVAIVGIPVQVRARARAGVEP